MDVWELTYSGAGGGVRGGAQECGDGVGVGDVGVNLPNSKIPKPSINPNCT